ncbi:MAG: hypothetical protein AAFX85_19795, partial [Pseudomonadota bacterium]
LEPLLVRTAVRGLRGVAGPRDAALLTPFLTSNSPAVVQEALDLLSAAAPDATLPAVVQTLEAIELEENVHPDIRRALERYFLEHKIILERP